MSAAGAVPAGLGAGSSQLAFDDRLSGAAEQIRGAPPSAAAVEGGTAVPETDPSTGASLPSATAQAIAEQQQQQQQNEHVSNGHHADIANGVNGAAESGKTLPASDSSISSPPAKKKGLHPNPTSSGAYASSGAYVSKAPEVQPHQPSPELKASWLSKTFFVWLNPLVAKGARHPLEDADMYEVTSEQESHGLTMRFEAEWAKEITKSKENASYTPDLTKALYRMFPREIWLGGMCKALIDGLAFLQPILLEWILTFVVDSQFGGPGRGRERPPDWHGYLLAAAIGLNPFLGTVLSNTYFHLMMTLGMRMRTILVTQLYRKSLRLSPGAKQQMNTGQIVNMMSTDTSKIDLFMGYIHYLWSALEQIAICIALLVRAIGPSALAGVGIVLLLIPIQGLCMKHLQDLRKATVKYTDRRVKLMNEILQGIRVIKVYAWENSFLQKLVAIRQQEMGFVRRSAYTRAWNSTLMQSGPVFMGLLAYITLGLTSDSFEPQYIFSSLTLFNLLRMPLLLFPMTLSFWSDARIGVQRIQAFLLAEELSSEPEYVDTDQFAVNVQNADFTWEKVVAEKEVVGESLKDAAASHMAQQKASKHEKEQQQVEMTVLPAVAAGATKKQDASGAHSEAKQQDETSLVPSGEVAASPERVAAFHLDSVNFSIPKGSLIVIVGAVGSGKSSLLAGILGEMKRTKGKVQIAGSVGFCPQQAWIQNATLKENIMFGLPFDQHKYDEAVRTCALQADIDVLPARDDTEIGEKGINLSGGQKQRVNLARAVYFDADVIMLDDPLSAVDAHVSKYLFNTCICDKLRDKTRILVTHQLQYVSSCDHVLFVDQGRIAESGSYAQLMKNKEKFFTLMSTYVGEENDSDEEDEEGEEGEGRSPRSSEAAGPAAASTTGEANVVPSGLGTLVVPGTTAASPERRSKKQRNRGLATARKSSAGGGDRPKMAGKKKKLDAEEARKAAEAKKTAASLMQAEERTKGGVPLSVYLYYVKHCGGWFLVAFAFFLMCGQTAVSNYVTWWLGLWSSDEYNKSNTWYLGIYAALGVGQVLFALVGTLVSAYMGVLAAVELHTKSFRSVTRAPMSFFDTTPIGRIINRFSKDQDVIDSMLMDTLRMIVFMGLMVIGTFVMIIIVTPIFLAPLAPILVVYYFVQGRYRHTSRELKRIESISRSPLYAHFSESLSGLATIRAYRAQNTFIQGNEARINHNNRSYFLLVLTQRWLSIRVETIGALIAFFSALFVVVQRDSLSAGEAGVSLAYAIGVTALLNWVVRQTVEAENSMNSVERSKFYTDAIAQERPVSIPETDEAVTAKSWPQEGAISFNNLQVRYRDGLPLVLHGISLDIKGGERVGIVGRTGAGKSSLMVALFRIVEAAEGSISIDGVDISTLGLDKLRTKLAIIPQDPVLFSGTIRSNLDPFDLHTDAELWSVLEKAYLKEMVSGLELKLLEPVSDGGENMSVGQRCQLCLARAMLRNAKVLIMDEATASVDMETDSFIQSSLRTHFNCTLLTIAHRLNTICDYDRVLVLSFGKVAEFDTPANLLRDPHSALSSMVNETGETNAALLRNIAFKKEKGQHIDIDVALGKEGALSTSPRNDASPAAAASASPQATDFLLPHAGHHVESSQVRWHDEPEHDDAHDAHL